MKNGFRAYLKDPLLYQMYSEIRRAGPVRSISLDLTHRCNIRCKGCYYFEEGMDAHASPEEESVFDDFIKNEKARGTNFVTKWEGSRALNWGG